MSIKSFVKGILIKREDARYVRLLGSRKTAYGEWAAAAEAKGWHQEREAALPEGELQGGEEEAGIGIVVICGGRGICSADMPLRVRNFFREHPKAQLLYGDEDVWAGAGRGDQRALEARSLPWFKPDWSPDLLDSFFYFGSLVVLREELFSQGCKKYSGQEGSGHGAESVSEDASPEGGVPAFLEARKPEEVLGGGQRQVREARGQKTVYYEVRDREAYERWIFDCVELAGGYERGCEGIGHISGILFHCENREAQERFQHSSWFRQERERELLENFRRSRASICVSVIIPSKDQPEILENCLEGCIQAQLPMEIIVVDNGSSRENRQRIQALLGEKEDSGICSRAVYLYQPQEFNFSRMCNLGAAQAKGEFLLFLNDDVRLCQPECLERLAALAGRTYTGAVGLKLYYPDSRRIQHAGITNLPMGPVHKLQFLEDDRDYYYGSNRGRRNVLAVTAACLMVEGKKYLEAGGFSEELRVAFNDVDFCFRLYELGYGNVCVNDGYAYHYESLSRGGDDSAEKLERLLGERDKLYERHPALEGRDPYYSVFLNREGLDTGIRPGCLTAGNRLQRISGGVERLSLAGYRRDACLMVRVEDCRKRRIVGYGVVLGDDNACYERKLLFGAAASAGGSLEQEPCEAGEPERGMVHAVELEGQYRPDLEENMRDQVHVALGGFDVEVGQDGVPAGRYRLGMAVRNRVTGLRLVNWSNRYVEL